MTTIEQIIKSETIPNITSMYLADISESRGKQDLFTTQTPQKLKTLREHALIQSAVSSSRIEGVEIDNKRIKPIILGTPTLKNRDEEEVFGYRQALDWIHRDHDKIKVNEKTIMHLHKLVKGEMWDAGQFREKSSDIIETYANKPVRIRFKTLDAGKIKPSMKSLINTTEITGESIHPLIAILAMNFDFLCIHPFRDGNGRVSRLLLLLQFYSTGYLAGRYISIERIIEQNKERYYETLEMSSTGWHKGAHNPWHYINFMLYILKTVYREFEENMEKLKSPKGAKTEMILEAIQSYEHSFSLVELERNCPGVSRDMIRKVLRDLKHKNLVKNLGRGPGAKWMRKGNTT